MSGEDKVPDEGEAPADGDSPKKLPHPPARADRQSAASSLGILI